MGEAAKNTIRSLVEKYPKLAALLKSGYFRKYQVQDALAVTKAEADIIVGELLIANIIQTTPFGYKMLKRTINELEQEGVTI